MGNSPWVLLSRLYLSQYACGGEVISTAYMMWQDEYFILYGNYLSQNTGEGEVVSYSLVVWQGENIILYCKDKVSGCTFMLFFIKGSGYLQR